LTGRTIYLGSRLSDGFARIYDKRAEVLARMNHDERRAALASKQIPEHWVRFELELKRNQAHTVALGLLSAEIPQEYALGVLRGKIDFKATSGNNRVRRRGAIRWWAEFTQSCAAVPIRIPRPVITIERIKSWVGHAVAPSIALLTRAYQGGLEWLDPLVREGEKRLDNKRLSLLNGFGAPTVAAVHSS
jgi:DNA relaxase NicK